MDKNIATALRRFIPSAPGVHQPASVRGKRLAQLEMLGLVEWDEVIRGWCLTALGAKQRARLAAAKAPKLVSWRRGYNGSTESRCGRWHIWPVYQGFEAPVGCQGYELRDVQRGRVYRDDLCTQAAAKALAESLVAKEQAS
jgi:hypothetical protein